MAQFFYEYGLFFVKVMTFVLAIAAIVGVISAAKKGSDNDDKLNIVSLNERYETYREQLETALLDKKALKAREKARKKADKDKGKEKTENKPKIFVLDFDGDMEASAVESLRTHISAVIQVATAQDKVLLRLESAGGLVHAYGLAASQLARLREKQIHLVVSIDKVAASGGYMMACIGDEILAAPFAIVGSVGVIGALPNFHDLLEKNNIHYEQHTAGKYKRSLTLFGENTDDDRAQFTYELAITHELFKDHIREARPALDVEDIATGETWYGSQAVKNGLIDYVGTSDDYILSHLDSHQLLLIEDEVHEGLVEKLKSRFLGKISAQQPFKATIR